MDYKDLQIEALTRALRTTDGLCEWCVGCQKLGLNHGSDCYENDCLQSENRGYDFVFATELVAEEFGITDAASKSQTECRYCNRATYLCGINTEGDEWLDIGLDPENNRIEILEMSKCRRHYIDIDYCPFCGKNLRGAQNVR